MNKFSITVPMMIALAGLSVAPAHGTNVENGHELNGVRLNGVRLNGVRLNGMRLNGVRLNGVRLNGVRLSGKVAERSARSLDSIPLTSTAISLAVR